MARNRYEDDDDDRPRKKRRPDDDEDDDHPRKKKRRREDDDEPTGWERYKGSAPRYIILGILLVVMLVLGFFLYQKYQRDQQAIGQRFTEPAVPATGP